MDRVKVYVKPSAIGAQPSTPDKTGGTSEKLITEG